MAVPAWEIVIIAFITVTIAATASYFFYRCYRSARAIHKDSAKRQDNSRPKGQGHWLPRPGYDIPEIYGVPYRSPPSSSPQTLDPKHLDNMVNRGSDLHPMYLEKRDERLDAPISVSSLQPDYKVNWSGMRGLLGAEFLPSITEYPVLEDLQSDSPAVAGGNGKPKKLLHVEYDKGNDGAPEIQNMVTEGRGVFSGAGKTSSAGDKVTNEQRENSVTKPDHVIIEPTPNRQLLKVQPGDWVCFDKDELTHTSDI